MFSAPSQRTIALHEECGVEGIPVVKAGDTPRGCDMPTQDMGGDGGGHGDTSNMLRCVSEASLRRSLCGGARNYRSNLRYYRLLTSEKPRRSIEPWGGRQSVPRFLIAGKQTGRAPPATWPFLLCGCHRATPCHGDLRH